MSASVPPEGVEWVRTPILELPGGVVCKVLFLGPLYGLYCHYPKKGTVPCYGHLKGCRLCPHDRRFFYAFAWGRHYVPERDCWRPVVIQCTANLEEQLRGRDVRGEVWDLLREPRKDNKGPVNGAFVLRLPESELTPARDVVPVLLRVWNVKEIPPREANAMPLRVMDQEVKITLPALTAVAKPTSTPEPAAAPILTQAQQEARLKELELEIQIKKREEYMRQAYGNKEGK